VDRRAVVSSAAGKRPVTSAKTRPIRHIVRGRGRLAGRIKKSCTSGLF
jgi:hypothetical protein